MPITWPATLKESCVGEFADDDWVEAGVAHELNVNVDLDLLSDEQLEQLENLLAQAEGALPKPLDPTDQ